VGGVIFDPGVEDVGEAVLAHEYIGKYPDALEDRIALVLIPPHLLQIVYRVHLLLVLLDVQQQITDRQFPPLKNRLNDVDIFLDVLLNKRKNRLTIIFWNVLRLVLIVDLAAQLPCPSTALVPAFPPLSTQRLFIRLVFDLDRMVHLAWLGVNRLLGVG
jgi:hypothetical protein